MAIKTDELQRASAPKSTDTLLMASCTDTDASGTAQLSLADLGRFLTEQDNAVRTALYDKADVSAQRTVEAVRTSTRDVTVPAEGLAAFINSLPRLLSDHYGITVSSGAVHPTLKFQGFYGPGSIWLTADGDVTLEDGAPIERSSAYIRLIGLKVRLREPNWTSALVYAEDAPNVSLESLDIDGESTQGQYGVSAVLSKVVIVNSTISNVGVAVRASGSSVVSANGVTGSGNKVGGRVYRGGVLLLSEGTPDLLGGASNSKTGGIIVKSDGTLL